MDRVPSAQKYPEAKPWVEHARTADRELQRLVNLTEEELAILRSLGPYLQFRGFRHAGLRPPPPVTEKCRIAFLLDTDRGPLTVKNVDDPLAPDWRPLDPLPRQVPGAEYFWDQVNWIADGVGSGLHLDDEPDDLFPLPVLVMASEHARTTRELVEFLRRYAAFWGGGNMLIYDQQFDVVAVEKCSRNHFQAYECEHGWNHISGMVCRDPESPQGRYQRARRLEYRHLYGLPDDGCDNTFWKASDHQERLLVQGIQALGPRPKAADVVRLFRTPSPAGLCKIGRKIHPDQPVDEYTQIVYGIEFDQRQFFRYRLDENRVMAREPEVCRFG